MRRAQAGEVGFPRAAAEGDIRTDVRSHFIASVVGSLRERIAEADRQGGPSKLSQFEDPFPFGHEVDQRVDDFSFAAAPGDEIKIVGPGYSGAQQLDHGRTESRRSDGERGQADDFSFRMNWEERKLTLASKMFPPAMQPFPRKEKTVRRARLEKIVPISPQALKGF